MKTMRVLAMMSGGVDSSVAAYLLRKQGHEVYGLTLRLFDPPQAVPAAGAAPSCCGSRKDACAAQDCCILIGIEHRVMQESKDFKVTVIDAFRQAYLNGETPNPCVECNRFMKFGKILAWAKEQGFDAVATGHYAQIWPQGAGKNNPLGLFKAKDNNKDQSYFLYMLKQEQLASILFPVGHLTKDEVRSVAREAGLPTADKPESQDICFVGAVGGDYRELLKEAQSRGSIVEEATGRVLGAHQGYFNFTVGQREGLGLSSGRPLYVTKIDATANVVYVGPDEALLAQCMTVGEICWVAAKKPQDFPLSTSIKIRYRAPAVPACLELIDEDSAQGRVIFASAQRAPTPGQFAVFYQGDQVLGGGKIKK